MSYQSSYRTEATRQQPARNAAEIEPLLIDDEFDDFLDREIGAIRESLTDFHSL